MCGDGTFWKDEDDVFVESSDGLMIEEEEMFRLWEGQIEVWVLKGH